MWTQVPAPRVTQELASVSLASAERRCAVSGYAADAAAAATAAAAGRGADGLGARAQLGEQGDSENACRPSQAHPGPGHSKGRGAPP
jgi:hypothetical protein